MRLTLLVGAILTSASLHAEPATYDEPGDVSSSAFLSTELQTGPNHTVSAAATSNGFQNEYTVSSKYGSFQATGINALKQTITEVDAMAYLEAVSRADVFVEALRDTGVETASAIAGVFTSPVQTVKGIPDGIDRVFAGAKRGFGLTKRLFQSKKDKDSLEPGDFREQNYLVGNSERQWAEELKTDPYTTNLKLREMVRSMSVVEFIGGLPVDIALPMGAGLAVGVLGDETEIYSQSADLLEDKNRSCLKDLGVNEKMIDAFIEAQYLTPTTQTAYCNALARLDGVANANGLTDGLVASASFEGSDFLLQSINLMAWYHTEVAPLSAVVTDDGLPYALDANSNPLVLLPAENLLWTELVASRLGDIKGDKRSIWILGEASTLANSQLKKAGWNISTMSSNEKLSALYTAET